MINLVDLCNLDQNVNVINSSWATISLFSLLLLLVSCLDKDMVLSVRRENYQNRKEIQKCIQKFQFLVDFVAVMYFTNLASLKQ